MREKGYTFWTISVFVMTERGVVYGGGGIHSPQRKKTYKAALQMMMQSGLVLQFLE